MWDVDHHHTNKTKTEENEKREKKRMAKTENREREKEKGLTGALGLSDELGLAGGLANKLASPWW